MMLVLTEKKLNKKVKINYEQEQKEGIEFDPLFAYPPMVFADRDPNQSNWYQIGKITITVIYASKFK